MIPLQEAADWVVAWVCVVWGRRESMGVVPHVGTCDQPKAWAIGPK